MSASANDLGIVGSDISHDFLQCLGVFELDDSEAYSAHQEPDQPHVGSTAATFVWDVNSGHITPGSKYRGPRNTLDPLLRKSHSQSCPMKIQKRRSRRASSSVTNLKAEPIDRNQNRLPSLIAWNPVHIGHSFNVSMPLFLPPQSWNPWNHHLAFSAPFTTVPHPDPTFTNAYNLTNGSQDQDYSHAQISPEHIPLIDNRNKNQNIDPVLCAQAQAVKPAISLSNIQHASFDYPQPNPSRPAQEMSSSDTSSSSIPSLSVSSTSISTIEEEEQDPFLSANAAPSYRTFEFFPPVHQSDNPFLHGPPVGTIYSCIRLSSSFLSFLRMRLPIVEAELMYPEALESDVENFQPPATTCRYGDKHEKFYT